MDSCLITGSRSQPEPTELHMFAWPVQEMSVAACKSDPVEMCWPTEAASVTTEVSKAQMANCLKSTPAFGGHH